jgi:hypothetical protein
MQVFVMRCVGIVHRRWERYVVLMPAWMASRKSSRLQQRSRLRALRVAEGHRARDGQQRLEVRWGDRRQRRRRLFEEEGGR